MSDDGATPDDEMGDYDSGPFCRHWGDPYLCEEKCGRCEHACMDHHPLGGGGCVLSGCDCAEWVETVEADDP